MLKKNGPSAAAARTKTGRGFRSLFARILTFVGGTVLAAFLAVGLVLLALVSSAVTNLTAKELDARSLSAAHEINAYFERHLEIVRTASANIELETLFTQVRPGDSLKGHEGFSRVQRTLMNIQTVNADTVLSVWVVDIDSSRLVQADGFPSPDGWDVKARPWYLEMNEVKAAVLTDPYEDTTTKMQVVTVVAPVFRPGSQDIIGAVGMDFSLDALGGIIQGYSLGETGFYILTTASGQVIYHPVQEYINQNVADVDLSDNIQQAMLSQTEVDLDYTSHGVDSHGYVARVGDTGWMIATGLPNAEFKAEFYAVRNVMLLILGVAGLAIAALLLVLSRQIAAPIRALTRTANQIAEGDLEVTAQVSGRDETGQMAEAINRTVVRLRRYIAYIREITQTLEKMAEGDMRIRLEEDYVGEFAAIRSAFEDLSQSLNHTLHTIDTAAEQVSIGSAQVSGGAQALASGSTQQAATVEELAASIEEVARQAADNSANVDIASQYIQQAATGFATGNQHMEQLAGAMEEIHTASNQIASITKVIEDIAFQTNILALNAAIEAARAGAAGKGFAVVADEVRNLAAKSAEAAHQTGELIQASVDMVDKGTQMTAQTAEILQDVGEKTVKVTESFDLIQRASTQQTEAIRQIREGISQVSAVVQTNAATAQENSATSEEMSAQAATLHREVGKFRLEGRAGAGDAHAPQPPQCGPTPQLLPQESPLGAGKY